jgi:hypothetical protein
MGLQPLTTQNEVATIDRPNGRRGVPLQLVHADSIHWVERLRLPSSLLSKHSESRPRLTGRYRYVWSAAELQAKTENDVLVCANVFGLWWSQRLRAMMDSARSLPY